jgi:very-short-patch-repair endonuclease
MRLLNERSEVSRVAQSEFERKLFRTLRQQGLPAPDRQYPVELPSGRRAYLDFAYPAALLAIEADSYRHHSSLSDWSRDHTRNNELISMGWRVLPVTFHDLLHEPRLLAARVALALSAQ